MNIASEKTLSREELLQYLENIRIKIMDYLNSLDDEMLYEIPAGCNANRLSLIISQYRHFYSHLGNINATTIIETDKYPRVIGISGKSGASTEGFYEY
jgi:hypothetical protein